MTVRTLIRATAALVIAVGGLVVSKPISANSLMCSASSSCGTCCYETDPEGLAKCCIGECGGACRLVNSFCCPGGFQIDQCLET